MPTIFGKNHNRPKTTTGVRFAPLAAALCFLTAPTLFAQSSADPAPLSAPLNPAYVKWLEDQRTNAERRALGLPVEPADWRFGYVPDPYLPPPLPPSRPLTQTEAMVKAGLAYYPPTYDVRQQGLVSEVRNQSPFGTCWAFGSIAALEANMRKNGAYPGDLSEWHLAYFAYNPINGIPGFTKSASASFGDDATFDQGGNFTRAMSILTRGAGAGGPVLAAAASYKGNLPTGLEESVATVQRTYLVSSASTDTIKGLLQEYGLVSVSMLWPTTKLIEPIYYNSSDFAFRMVQIIPSSNHVVNIVGWDDAFPKGKFPTVNQPASDGAWIVRNSWGHDWGDGGYFYMSYDTSLISISVYVGQEGADEKTYQYDMHGRLGVRGYTTSTAWFSNIFTADGDHLIKAVAFYSSMPSASYEISVRKSAGSTPTNGGTVALDRQSGTLGVPGYNRIALDTPIMVGMGERFAIIVKLTDPSYGFPIAYSYARSGLSDDATALPGVGFISSNGSSWTDITASGATQSVCLKAFADMGIAVPVSSIGLNKASMTLSVGDAESLNALIQPTDATNKTVNWTSSNTSIASVSSLGLVRGAAKGSATITATSAADKTKFDTCTVTVYEVPVSGIRLNKASTTLSVGDTETIQATFLPANATNQNVHWTSSNTSIATVSDFGQVLGVAEGEALITATSAADSTKSDTCTVTVYAIPVSSVSLNKTSMALLAGSTETLVAVVMPANASNKNVNWASSDTSVATVSDLGLVTGVAVGTATITATSQEDSGKFAACAVAVSPVPIASVELDKTSITLDAGASETLTATVQPSNATNKNVHWISSDTTIATVSDFGLVQGAAAGTATIKATCQADSTKFATCYVTVNPLIAISVSPKALFVDDGAPLQASIIGLANGGVIWSVQLPEHGTVTQAGAYTAPSKVPQGDGVAIITAASVQMPTLYTQAKILIRSLDWTKLGDDNNTKTSPQLLDLAHAFGSIAQADLDKYDINGDGIIDDEDLAMLFRALGW